MMQEGPATQIEYQAWDGSLHTANLGVTDYHKDNPLHPGVPYTDDPLWTDWVTGQTRSTNEWLSYQTDIGRPYRMKCHCQVDMLRDIHAHFEHDGPDGKHPFNRHDEGFAYVKDWNGAVWTVSLKTPMRPPYPQQVTFVLAKGKHR